jgi:hypothetical protein
VDERITDQQSIANETFDNTADAPRLLLAFADGCGAQSVFHMYKNVQKAKTNDDKTDGKSD